MVLMVDHGKVRDDSTTASPDIPEFKFAGLTVPELVHDAMMPGINLARGRCMAAGGEENSGCCDTCGAPWERPGRTGGAEPSLGGKQCTRSSGAGWMELVVI